MTAPALTAKSQLGALVWQVSTAVQELERYVAEQRKIARRRKKAGLALVSAGRRRKSAKSDRRKPIAYSKVN
jgi:hypothetical protein